MYNLIKSCLNDETFRNALVVTMNSEEVTAKLFVLTLGIKENKAEFYKSIMLDMGFLDKIDVVKCKNNLTRDKLNKFINDINELDLSKVDIEEVKKSELFNQIVFLLQRGKVNCLRDIMDFANIDTIEAIKYFYVLEELGYVKIG